MGKRTIIPFGPQHPVLPEPVHLDLVIEDERVVEAIPSIGYIHRGLEKLVEKKESQSRLVHSLLQIPIHAPLLGWSGQLFVYRFLCSRSLGPFVGIF